MKVKSESEVAQSYLTLSDPMDSSLPGSSIHEIFQARVLEWGAIVFSVVSKELLGGARKKNIVIGAESLQANLNSHTFHLIYPFCLIARDENFSHVLEWSSMILESELFTGFYVGAGILRWGGVF